MKRSVVLLGSLLVIAAVLPAAGDKGKGDGRKLPPAARGKMDFRRHIRPILARSCVRCHGPKKTKGGLRLDSRSAALEGGDSGEVIKPGDALHSRLLHLVAGLDPKLKMPPEGTALTKAEIGRLRAWIDQGARWPKGVGVTVAPEKLWSFTPPRRPPLPKVPGAAWVRNPIDPFILARLEKENLRPSPEADRVTLLRRLSLDLTGLPPSPVEVDRFLRDKRPGAYEGQVDRLLASPHYGERWGRHWLDLARYADSDGFEKDKERPHAWRYRHWIIATLNRDLPYDRFVIEQLAGDLLPRATIVQKVATGFHRNTLTNREDGVDREEFRVEQTVDRTNTTATVFLGLTLGCAQCHDHKYDPFSQREYYQFFAFFNGLEEKDIVAPVAGEWERYRKAKAEFDKRKASLEGALGEYKKKRLPVNQRRWEKNLKPAEVKKLPANIRAILAVVAGKRSAKQRKELADYYAKIDDTLEILTGLVEDHRNQEPKVSMAQILEEGKGRKTHVLLRGEFLKKGAEVQPGVPAVLPGLKKVRRGRETRAEPLTRLDLARWIVSKKNPLTARVAVNRLWQHYFGRGLVATPEDFGSRGEKPTHSELLDWLATELIRQRWGMKAMHRLIVTSATYRQASALRPDLGKRDPQNHLLARQSRLRLEAEAIRDAALAASGLLYRTIGGPSVRPPQPPGVAEVTFLGKDRWIESKGPDRYRRGLYTFFRRTSPYPNLLTFDAPDSNVTCTRRTRTNTPLQALVLLNDPVYVEAAQALARRVLVEAPRGKEARIRYAFRLCLAREPGARESLRLGRLLDVNLRLCRASPGEARILAGKELFPPRTNAIELAAWVGVCRILLNLDEFITRE
jgi:hypothetical protein